MRKILMCFMAFLLVMMIALIASVGPAQSASEPTAPYNVWGSPVTEMVAIAGMVAVGILAAILLVSSGALYSMSQRLLSLCHDMKNHNLRTLFRTILKIAFRRHGRHGFSWRTPLIKPT